MFSSAFINRPNQSTNWHFAYSDLSLPAITEWEEIPGVSTVKYYYLVPSQIERVVITNEKALGNNALTNCPAKNITIKLAEDKTLSIGKYAISVLY